MALDEDEFVWGPILHRKVKVVGVGVLALLRHVQVAGKKTIRAAEQPRLQANRQASRQAGKQASKSLLT